MKWKSLLMPKGIQIVKVVQLHGVGEIQNHVAQVRTFGGQFVEDWSTNVLDGQLDIFELGSKSLPN